MDSWLKVQEYKAEKKEKRGSRFVFWKKRVQPIFVLLILCKKGRTGSKPEPVDPPEEMLSSVILDYTQNIPGLTKAKGHFPEIHVRLYNNCEPPRPEADQCMYFDEYLDNIKTGDVIAFCGTR